MNPIIKNILAVLSGGILGSAVNMGIIMISSSIIPPPDGADVTTMEGLKASLFISTPTFYFSFLSSCDWNICRRISDCHHCCKQ